MAKYLGNDLMVQLSPSCHRCISETVNHIAFAITVDELLTCAVGFIITNSRNIILLEVFVSCQEFLYLAEVQYFIRPVPRN